jgi:c-di-GMP-binding flagellar brake protein YcgR
MCRYRNVGARFGPGGRCALVDSSQDTLREAIARNSGAVLSLPSAGYLRHHKTRFLADAGDGFWIESVPEENRLVDELIAARTSVGLTFKTKTEKIVFAAPILVRQDGFPVNRTTTAEALLLCFPEQIKAVQRRSSYRLRMGPNPDLLVRMWRITEKAYLKDKPSNVLEIPLALKDISAGGMGVLCPPQDCGDPQRLVSNQRLRVQLNYEENEVLLEGRSRHIVLNADQSMRVGVQFRSLEEDIEGRQALSKLNTILAQLSREQARRVKLGLSVG